MKRNQTIFLLSFLVIILTGIIIFISPYYQFFTKKLNISPIKTLLSVDSLKTYNNQVNLVILGIAGGSHQGPNLSDTIIVANYNFKSNQLTTISIPRDIWSPTIKDKINSAYAYGEEKQKGGGFKLAKAEIEAVVGIPIHYAVVINFDKFRELVDFFGGIDVEVERSFTDDKFPIEGKENDLCGGNDPAYSCRYQTISFLRGITHMNGETALKFVRSRQAEGDEGSDFARERRQQKVVDAVKNALISLVKKRDIKKLEALYDVVNVTVSRDITNQQLAIILKNIIFNKRFKQTKIFLSEDFFIVPEYSSIYDEKWVLLPKKGDFSEVHQYIDSALKKEGKEN